MNTYWTTYCVTVGKYELECDVEYQCTSGDSGICFYPDGSGEPPTPPEVELISVKVVSVYSLFSDYVIDGLWLVVNAWDAWANKIAWRVLEGMLETDTDFYRKLVDEVTEGKWDEF